MSSLYTMGHIEKNGTPYVPTILNSNEAFLDNCPKCDRTRYNYSSKNLSLLVEGKGMMPDFLKCGHYPIKIVSERALKSWEEAGITGYTSFPVTLFDNKKKEIVQPRYHNIMVTGEAELDFGKMGVVITNICDVCDAVDYNKPTWEFGAAIMKENTYDATDLFVFKYFEASPTCTTKLLETVYRDKLTNFRFCSFETKFMFMAPKQYIDLKAMFNK